MTEHTLKKAPEAFTDRDYDLLEKVNNCVGALQTFRAERKRCKRFTYGDQWIDTIEDAGVRMKEEDFIRSQGNVPLKNNLIRRLVRNVLGVFRNRMKLPECVARDPSEASRVQTMNLLLKYNQEANQIQELYARTMEEFLISGLIIHKKWFGQRNRYADCQTDLISPAKFFFDNSAGDIRGHDISLVGEIHTLTFTDLCASIARNPAEIRSLENIYGTSAHERDAKFKVIEVWERQRPMRLSCHDRQLGKWYNLPPEKEASVQRLNSIRTLQHRATIEIRYVFEEIWQYTFMTPDGLILKRGNSPYSHRRHPYVIKAYPFLDGEIHSFVGDIIDQQKLTNRLISMYDWILRASAKGVLLFPEGSLPDGVDINDVAEEWSRFNGVIVFRPRAGVPLPQQVSSKVSDIGITQLLEIQMNMMEDISGVNGALQGKLDSTTMSGTLYDQQTRNSMSALADILKSFDDFILQATMLDASNIRQFYSPRLIKAIIGTRPGYSTNLESTDKFFNSPFDFSFLANTDD